MYSILDPILKIVDEQGQEVGDRYYKAGSSMELSCRVSRSYTGSLTTTTTMKPDMMKLFKITSTSSTSTSTSSSSVASTTSSVTSTTGNTITTLPQHHNHTQNNIKLPPKNNYYGITWHKDGKLLTNKITWKNTRLDIHSSFINISTDGIL